MKLSVAFLTALIGLVAATPIVPSTTEAVPKGCRKVVVYCIKAPCPPLVVCDAPARSNETYAMPIPQ